MMKQPNVAVYGTKTCPDSIRTTRFLEAHQVPYEFIDLDQSPELDAYVANVNDGDRKIPNNSN